MEPQLTCPECDGSEIVLEAAVGRDPLVRYYRCAACGHEWGVTLPLASVAEGTEDQEQVEGHGGDAPPAEV